MYKNINCLAPDDISNVMPRYMSARTDYSLINAADILNRRTKIYSSSCSLLVLNTGMSYLSQ